MADHHYLAHNGRLSSSPPTPYAPTVWHAGRDLWSFVTLVRSTSHVIVVAIALSAILLLSACALPGEGLWPPAPDSPARAVIVSLDTWHAMIAFPIEPSAIDSQLSATEEEERSGAPSSPGYQPSAFSSEKGASSQHSSLRTQHLYEEWGYAERAWYLEGKTGLTGVLRAILWPTDGIVEMGRYDRVWADRTPQPPAERFEFRLSEEGYRRLRRHLQATLLRDEPIASFRESVFYPARRSYHLFHTCHEYAAHALREAGLPISPFWAFNRTSLAWQLRRATQIASERSTSLPPSRAH